MKTSLVLLFCLSAAVMVSSVSVLNTEEKKPEAHNGVLSEIRDWLSSKLSSETRTRKVAAPAAAPATGIKNSAGVVCPKQSGASEGLKICTWNVFRFGQKKFEDDPTWTGASWNLEKKTKLKMMVEQIQHMDIVAIQEYFDTSPDSIIMQRLAAALTEETKTPWAFKCGKRVGRTVTSQEQNCFLFKTKFAQLIKAQDYVEDGEDVFSREPLYASFKITKPGTSMKEVCLGTIHTEPKEAVREINELARTTEWAEKVFNTKEVMTLGDYNADCQYVKKSEWAPGSTSMKMWVDKAYKWFIPHETKTAAMTSMCTFDRAVSKGEKLKAAFERHEVLDFVCQYNMPPAKARLLSDHFPVCLHFK